MDKGNHYLKCDLQIHTPRDINWKNGNEVSEAERNEYSKQFIKDCREASLDAIAITDHHDMIFYEYIKQASEEETDSDGNLLNPEKRIIIFPGVELTLHSPPIQGLLIFDSNFPQSLFPTILGTLSLIQAPRSDSKTSPTQAIPSGTISSINDIYEKLDGNETIKGRYIFLPHVKEKGHRTLMRTGFHEAYSKMICGGGYVDGKYENPGVGYKNIMNGEVEAYGFKSIAVIQTTDFRGDCKIGELDIATWIKMKEPTAEALRQACLAKESRISLTPPEIPNIYIEKIDVTNSVFLSKFNLDFNPQLNSVIGGRGSGKSTILEYLRWALCDQTETFGNDDVKSEIERKRNSLIDKTLKEVDGEVRIFFSVNGTRHIIKRNPKLEDVLLKIGDNEFEKVRPKQISDLFPIQSYSQKQLSSVSIQPKELKRFIERPISQDLEEIDRDINNAVIKVKKAYEDLAESKSLSTEIQKNKLESKSFRQQIEKLKEGLKGISPEDKRTIDRAKLFVNEKNRFDEIEIEYSNISSHLIKLKELSEKLNDEEEIEIEYENKVLITNLEEERKTFLTNFTLKLVELEGLFNSSQTNILELNREWQIIRDSFVVEYKKAKEKSTSSQATLTSIKSLEEKLERLDLLMRQKNVQLNGIKVNESDFENIFNQFIMLQTKKTEKLKNSTEQFTRLSDGFIKVDFSNIIDTDSIYEKLVKVFSSYTLNIPKIKIQDLAEKVSSDTNPLEKWKQIIFELKFLSEFHIIPEVQEELPHTPILDNIGFTMANKRKISENLNSDGFMSTATIKLDFLPKFKYQTHNQMEDVIAFEDASAGQQATALLNVLLNQDGFPLIIDQPEDDIDNRAIESIIKNLWSSKKKRQIIISSHNANLVVNGDSELVVCCDYNETSDQTKGHIKFEGSIDKKEIRDEITSVMEGGERAFKLRKEKYGF